MQRCDCTVRLSGDVNNTVAKFDISIAEISVLRAIHGEGSVVDIKPVRQCKTPHRDERDRLMQIYGVKKVEAIFPGAFARLPVTMKDIEPPTEEEEQASRPDKTKAAPALPVFGLPEDEDETADAA